MKAEEAESKKAWREHINKRFRKPEYAHMLLNDFKASLRAEIEKRVKQNETEGYYPAMDEDMTIIDLLDTVLPLK